jgi:hypothetical protein
MVIENDKQKDRRAPAVTAGLLLAQPVKGAELNSARRPVAKHGIPGSTALRPAPAASVIDKVGFTADKIRAAGKVAGTLVTADELPYGLEKGLQFFYVHSAPSVALDRTVSRRRSGGELLPP